MTRDTWEVSVTRNGDNVLTIGSNHLAGRDLSEADEAVIRTCGEHLLSFIGEAAHRQVEEAAALLTAPPREEGLSLSMRDDPLAIGALLDDSTREREMYHRLISDIRTVLGEDGLHAQLLDLPKVIAAKLTAPEGVPPWGTWHEMLSALKLIESVYRKNCVAEGEPSTLLAVIQAAIANAEASAPPGTPSLVAHCPKRGPLVGVRYCPECATGSTEDEQDTAGLPGTTGPKSRGEGAPRRENES